MSQLRRQATDHHLSSSASSSSIDPLSPFPTPSSRQPALPSDPVLRDYLTARPDAVSPRSPIPFPLQTTSQPLPPSRADSTPSQSPQSPRSLAYPPTLQNRPTISRVAHAAFPAPPSGITPSSPNPPPGSRNSPVPNQNDRDMNDRTTDSPSRRTPCTTDPNQSATSSPVSPGHSSLPMSKERPGQRSMPRTSSIDSAISSLSSASQSHKSSFDANAVTQADIDNLVATAGSPEAVIIHLLKEKHHAASQNSQLWRLVDKQRTLILGLNKDLERAIKEKDRYKKKVKDLQNTAPPLPQMQEHAQPTGTAGVSGASNSQGSTSQAQAPNVQAGVSYDDFETPSLLNNAPASSNINPGKQRTVPANDGSNQRFDQGTQPLQYSRQELATASPTSLASSSSLTSDRVTGENRQQGIPAPVRKPPPAPLNLEPRERAAGNAAIDDSESEYEDILEADELPIERGRRKTRDDDDREREAALAREQAKENLPLLSVSGDVGASSYGPSDSRPQAEFLASTTSPRVPQGSMNGHSIATAPKSPGLPLSPRPEDRPLGSPLPRMPRDLPPNLSSMPTSSGNNLSGLALTPRVSNYPHPYTGGPSQLSGSVDPAMRPIPSIDAAVKIDSPHSPEPKSSVIYQGLVSDEYPGLLLPPNALPVIQVKVSSSRLRPSRNSLLGSRPLEEEPVFTLSVFSRSDRKELWRVEKVIAALPQLDYQLRQLSVNHMRLPDRSIFSGQSPAKIDARRAALNAYFGSLLDTDMDERAALVICQFLTSDAIEPRDDETSLLKGNNQGSLEILRGPDGKPRKEGYLTKRGKNFGGWKARYFILHGPELKYFESPGGAHLGTIKIYNAQIGKQSQATNGSPSRVDDDSENQYRHAFLILEPKKKDSSALVRHVLCAESDEERDAWVEALLEYVEGPSENEGVGIPSGKPYSANPRNKAPANGSRDSNKPADNQGPNGPDTVQGFSFDDAVPAQPPVFGPSLDQQGPKSPMLPPGSFFDMSDAAQNNQPDQAQVSSKVISGPTNGAVIQDAGAWGNKATTSAKEKKRSIWGFRTRSSYDLASQLQANNEPPMTPSQNTFGERRDFVRPVFGIPLAEAVQFCPPQGEGVDVDLPAVVYRCIEYLKAKGAESEEGIFRLSGSNVVVKALKERFNTEGDVDFLSDEHYYDVHAVASLFKQYLRELPTSVLTRELHIEFLRVLELTEKEKKIVAFNALVHRLPKTNLALLRALVQFLIIIVNNSDVNKMTVRNVGIVFAPTLNIPAPVFSLFLTEFESIFEHSPYSAPSNIELAVPQSMSAEDIRSPRRQMFSDIPTPADSTFRRNGDPRDDIPGRHDTGFIPMQPSYEQDRYNQDAGMLLPNPDSRSSKAKRRESSLMFMDMNHQAPGTGLPDSRGELLPAPRKLRLLTDQVEPSQSAAFQVYLNELVTLESFQISPLFFDIPVVYRISPRGSFHDQCPL
ncbi:hypothetical protein BDV59DRAFT_198782 [Aspergillus ambiguus]|uniref:GTPase-activating protein BEM3 n=1 Tax=Aspergillus ambiguus TaxID=176160 RepID=UPI003CCCB00D